VAPHRLALRNVDEIKVVFPDYDPQSYIDAGVLASHHFVQPRASCVPAEVGKSLLDRENMRQAADYVMKNPHWRLSIQTHKVAGLP
jgi:organic radical activating enzyme